MGADPPKVGLTGHDGCDLTAMCMHVGHEVDSIHVKLRRNSLSGEGIAERLSCQER